MSEKYAGQAGIIETLWDAQISDESWGLGIFEKRVNGIEETVE